MGRKITWVTWDFGDGTRATGPKVTHTYSIGKYGAIVRARYENEEQGIDVVYVKVHPQPAPSDIMLHCSFEDRDVKQWGYLMKIVGYNSGHLNRGAGAERVRGGYESEWSYRLFASHYEASFGRRMFPSAGLYPGQWKIDKYPFVRFAYRIPQAMPVGLAVELYPTANIDGTTDLDREQRTIVIGGTTSRESDLFTDTADYKLTDDGKWHKTTIDIRAIRKVHETIDYIRGFRFYMPRNVKEGQQFWLDELSVMP